MAPRDPSNRLGTILINPVILPVPVERQHSLDLPQDGTTTSSSFSSSSSSSFSSFFFFFFFFFFLPGSSSSSTTATQAHTVQIRRRKHPSISAGPTGPPQIILQ